MKRIGLMVAILLSGSVASAQPPGRGGPPQEAVNACSAKSEGVSCAFRTPRGQVEGVCRNTPHGKTCVPDGADRMPQAMQRGSQQGSMAKNRAARAEIVAHDASAKSVVSRIPDTHQGSCFDDKGVIPCPGPGQRWFGQDAQYEGALPDYRDNGDSTVTDRVTGLMWQQGHNEKRLGWYDAKVTCDALNLGGHGDWRLPTIRELFSLIDFRGSAGSRPYLDETFEIREPDASILQNDRFRATHRTDMMGQTWSATVYSGDHWGKPGVKGAFFVNFFDGRIKQAPLNGKQGLFYRCVRGEEWGINDFVENHDGTVSDRFSGLMWQQADDGASRDWEGALSYCEGLSLAGHDDWRLPNVKELQGIVDYRHNDPAIDTNMFRQYDNKGWFWSSTTHGDNVRQAAYICFGKCTSVHGVDVHGAGAQRSDPKSGDPRQYSSQGGQEDEIRIRNYVRCVR